MRIPLDRQSDTPIYRQIERYLRQSILAGSLAPDTRLPAARQLAQDLGISRVTVENAYAVLEADGLVLRRAGSGTYVAAPLALPPQLGGASSAGWPLWQLDAQARGDMAQEPSAPEPSPALRPPLSDRVHGVWRPAQLPRRRVLQGDQGCHAPRRERRAGIWRYEGLCAAAHHDRAYPG